MRVTGQQALALLLLLVAPLGTSAAAGGYEGEALTSEAPWALRKHHTLTAFKDSLVLTGGFFHANDVWQSPDGESWERLAINSPWAARYGHSVTALGESLILIGGYGYNGGSKLTHHNDVWSSTDGQTWSQLTATAPWAGRRFHAAAVLGDELVIAGGFHPCRNDVWASTDGVNWVQRTDAAPWSPRYGHTMASFDGQLILGGGHDGDYKNDVWSSPDGTNWALQVAAAPWEPRRFHAAGVLDTSSGGSKMVLGAGCAVHRRRRGSVGDVWSSHDGGQTWLQELGDGYAQWNRWSMGGAAVFGNRLVLAGGSDGESTRSDVWAVTAPELAA